MPHFEEVTRGIVKFHFSKLTNGLAQKSVKSLGS